MLAAKFAFQSPQAVVAANARRTGTASTNSSQTWTASGAVTSTAQFKFGTASEYVAATTDEIYTSAGSPTFMNYGTGEFTLEWWMYIPTLSGHSGSCDVMSNDVAGGFGMRLASANGTNGLSSANPKYLNIFARQQADLDYWDISTRTGGGNWTTGQWYFCALQRKGTTLSLWVDGNLCTRSGSGGGSRNFASNSGNTIKVGTADGGDGVGPAYIDEFCWSNTYRYDDPAAAIPVPTAAFTVDSYTTQLMHMDGSNGGTTFTNATS
jgi:hypothetical protein